MRKPFVILRNISEDSFECLNSSPFLPKLAYVPNWEKVFKLLSCISFFIEREPLVQDMGVLFPGMQWIPVEVDEDPNQSFIARLPYGTPYTTIAYIIHMKDYTALRKW